MKILRSLFLMSSAALLLSTPARADEASDVAKIESLLTQAGYKYQTTTSSSVFWVPMTGKNLGDFHVILATGDGLEVIFVIIAKKAEMNVTPALAMKMLSLNHEYDRVKVGLDDDGDAFVRDDVSIRVLDAEELKANVEQVASGADEAYGEIKPYLK